MFLYTRTPWLPLLYSRFSRTLATSVTPPLGTNSKFAPKLPEDKASPEQLAKVADVLVVHIPKFFLQSHPFTLYTNNVIFINNIKPIRTEGITRYALYIALMKLLFSIRYSSCGVEVLNLVKHPEESCIKIRWRLFTTTSLMKMVAYLFKGPSSLERFHDGFSTFFVDRNGLVYCHICDNIDIEINELKGKKAIKNPLVSKSLNV